MIIEKETEPDEPRRALLRRMRKHQPHRPDDVRRCLEQDLALGQGLAHQAELVIFEIAQAAMDVLAGARARPLGEIVLLSEHDRQTTAGGIASDAGAIDAAADDEKIDWA